MKFQFRLLIIGLLAINYTFFKPTKINFYIASKLYKTPANTAFTDDNFYKCVVDTYNKENNTNKAYTESLTNEELQTITYLDCDEKQILTADGLEKLTSLTGLSLTDNELTSLDVSHNPDLKYLYVNDNELTSMNVSNNPKLTHIHVYQNQLASLDIHNAPKLERLIAYRNQLTTIDLSNNVFLEGLRVDNNDLTHLDISKNVNLKWLNVGNNQITSIDVSHNPDLEDLDIRHLPITSLDLSKNPNLKELYAFNNQLTKIDVTNNISLESLNVSYNKLTDIDLSKNTVLEELDLSDNFISEINISNNLFLKELDLGYNYISEINLKNHLLLEEIYLEYNLINQIDLSNNKNISINDFFDSYNISLEGNPITKIVLFDNYNTSKKFHSYSSVSGTYQEYINFGLGKIIQPKESCKYKINDYIQLDAIVTVGDLIDSLGLKKLTAKVYDSDGEEVTNGQISSEYILKIYDGEIVAQDLKIKILASPHFDDMNLYKCIIDEYNRNATEELTYEDEITTRQLQTITGLLCSDKIQNPKGIEQLTELKYLELEEANFKTIDLGNNLLLEYVWLDNEYSSTSFSVKNYVQLEQINLEANKNLNTVYIGSKKIKEINVSQNTNLTYLLLNTENLPNVDISKNQNLEHFAILSNSITSLDLRNNKKLKVLGINSESLTNLNLMNNINLVNLELVLPNIETLDFSYNEKVETIAIESDKLNNLDIEKNIVLDKLYLKTKSLSSLNITNNNITYLDISESEFKEDKKIYLYKNEQLEIPKTDTNIINFKEGYFAELTSINKMDDLIVEDNMISFAKLGNYNVETLYNHNIQSELNSYKIIYDINVFEITSSKYVIDDEKNYIYIGTDKNTEDIERNIKIPEEINLNIDLGNNKLQVKHNENILKEFTIININFGDLVVNRKFITINEDIPYEDFISNITPNGVTYKIFNKEAEVTEGTITKDMVLKIYKDEEEIYEYQITDEFLDLSLLNVDEENLLIKDLKLGTTISSFKDNISTSGRIKVLDQDGEELKDTDLVRSGAKVIIELSKDKYEYTLSVKGDVTGTGTSTVSDVGKLYQYLRKKITMDLCYIAAGNVIDTDNEIKITDVGKLYQFIKGKIESLED